MRLRGVRLELGVGNLVAGRDKGGLMAIPVHRVGRRAFGKYRLTESCESGATVRSTGSLMAGAPGGMMIELLPPKVSAWSEPGWIFGSVGCQGDMGGADLERHVPYSLERTIRTLLPPMLTRAICRIVLREEIAGKAEGKRKVGLPSRLGACSPGADPAASSSGCVAESENASAAPPERRYKLRHDDVSSLRFWRRLVGQFIRHSSGERLSRS